MRLPCAWAEENRERFGFATHEVLCRADETIERIAKRSARGREHLLKTVMGAFWPEDAEAEAGEALVEVQSAVRNLPAAHLPRVGEYCLEELREGRETRALPPYVCIVRLATPPIRIRPIDTGRPKS